MKFKNPNSTPCIPKSWKGTLPNGEPFKISWPCSIPYGAFYSQIVRFYSDNGMNPPTTEAVANDICRQIPKSWCVDDNVYIAPAPVTAPCKSCGRGW